MTVALTTGIARARELGPEELMDALGQADAGAVVLEAGLDAARLAGLERLLSARGGLPVVALEAPLPAGRWSSAELCAADKAEAQVALEAAVATVERAGRLGARFVALGLGTVPPLAGEWAGARDRFLRGALSREDRLARRLGRAREQAADRALDQARRALERLARAAESAGVTLALRNPRRFVELPSARELELLVAELRGAPLAPMFDAAAAHLTDLMGFQPLELTVAAFARPAALAYVGDACGPVGALPPGRGLLDVPALLRALPPECTLAFSPWPGLRPDEIASALRDLDQLRRESPPPRSGGG